jgi:ketosteroid isomerase-like protein
MSVASFADNRVRRLRHHAVGDSVPGAMSRQNVEIVRQIYERWGRGDFRAGGELYDPYVLLVLRPEFPDARAYIGPDEIRRYMRDDFLADLEGALIVGEEFLEAGDSVVVRVNQQATGAGSGVPVGIRYYQIWTFRGKSVIRIESVRERGEALEAAGLSD